MPGHIIEEARARGWDTFQNGDLLDAAEAAGFDVFVTTDMQPPVSAESDRPQIAIVVLGNGRWKLIQQRLPDIAAAVDAAQPGTLVEIAIPAG